jgi:phage gp29-like protein
VIISLNTFTHATPVAAAAPKQQMSALMQIIRPDARERWAALDARGLTPERVQDILRNALGSTDVAAQWELFDLMEDSWYRLSKNLNERKKAVISLLLGGKLCVESYEQTGSEEPSPLAVAKKELVEAAMLASLPSATRNESGWRGCLYDAMDAVGKGISVQEILWNRAVLNGKPAIVPRAYKWVHPVHYGYPFAFRVMDNGADAETLMLAPRAEQDWQEFPADKFLVCVCKSRTGHPATTAMLRSLAPLWMAANFAQDWMLNLAQMFGIPMRWATYDPSNPGLLPQIEAMLANLGSAGWGAFPAGTTLELKEAIKSATDNPQNWLITFADVACDILILGQTLTTSQGTKGSQALGEVHNSVRGELILADATWLCEVLNEQLVPALMRLNFGSNDEDPWLEIEQEEVKDLKAMAERDAILLKLGMQFSKKWFHDRHEVPEPAPDEELLTPSTNTTGSPDAAATRAGNVPPNNPEPLAGKLSLPASGLVVKAKSADEKLVERMMEDISGIAAEWLAPVKPFFARLVELAKDSETTDAQFVAAVEKAQSEMSSLLPKLNGAAVANALEGYMTAGLFNGVTRGVMTRGKGGVA